MTRFTLIVTAILGLGYTYVAQRLGAGVLDGLALAVPFLLVWIVPVVYWVIWMSFVAVDPNSTRAQDVSERGPVALTRVFEHLLDGLSRKFVAPRSGRFTSGGEQTQNWHL